MRGKRGLLGGLEGEISRRGGRRTKARVKVCTCLVPYVLGGRIRAGGRIVSGLLLVFEFARLYVVVSTDITWQSYYLGRRKMCAVREAALPGHGGRESTRFG